MTANRIITGTVFSGSRSNLSWRVNSRIRTVGHFEVLSVLPSESNANSRADYSLVCLERPTEKQSSAFGSTKSPLQQFSATVSALEDCSHPNLVEMIDYHLDGFNSYYVSVRFESDRLSHWLPQGRFASQPVALWITRQITSAVCQLHSAGWLHGSISPESVRVSSTGQAELSDLFTARRIRSVEDSKLDVAAIQSLLFALLNESRRPIDTPIRQFLDRAGSGDLTAAECLKELQELEMKSFATHIQPKKAA